MCLQNDPKRYLLAQLQQSLAPNGAKRFPESRGYRPLVPTGQEKIGENICAKNRNLLPHLSSLGTKKVGENIYEKKWNLLPTSPPSGTKNIGENICAKKCKLLPAPRP